MTNPTRRKATGPHRFLQVAALLLLLLLAATPGRAQFAVDGFNPNANGIVWVVVVQPDGKILIGGDFTTLAPNGGTAVTRNHIARLNQDGSLDTAFNPNANGAVLAILVQTDGKILTGGEFTGIGGQPRNHIARLEATTGFADSFDPQANNPVWSFAVQPDGKLLTGGQFGVIGGQQRSRIARLDLNTGLADSFNPSIFGNGVRSIVVQADGKILLGGEFFRIVGQMHNYIGRIDPTTNLPDSFNPNPNEIVRSIALQADGKILVGGFFSTIGGQARNHVARLDPVTGLADSFDPNASDYVHALAIQPDGKILVGGWFTTISGQPRNRIARLDPTTGLADWFNPNVMGSGPFATAVSSIAVQEDGKILAGGSFNTLAPDGDPPVTRNNIARLEPKPATLGNISTRLRVQTGDNAMIGGFIISGTQPKTVVVRGLGPSLPVAGALTDPVIEVHGPTGELLATNDNWNDAATRQQIIDSGLAPMNNLESALWGVINPGAYTIVIRGKNGATGLGLFEVYDLDHSATSKLGNISTRGFVDTGDNVMIGGTIIVGEAPSRVLLRAIGPTLTNFGVPNALGDPILGLYDANGQLIAINYDWRDDQAAEIIATGLAPSNDLESAILRDLTPGNYTAIVRGSDDTPGVALIEAYDLD